MGQWGAGDGVRQRGCWEAHTVPKVPFTFPESCFLGQELECLHHCLVIMRMGMLSVTHLPGPNRAYSKIVY